MAEKSDVNDDTDNDVLLEAGAVVAVPLLEDFDEPPPHAASPREVRVTTAQTRALETMRMA
jgi:hypothetical protein